MIFECLKSITPKSIKHIIRKIIQRHTINKYDAELSFWKSRCRIDNGLFRNSHFEKLMLAMAGETSNDFVRGKIIADFGCGPRGSLVWAESAIVRIGIDVLADRYAEEFKDNIISHRMIYLKSTEKVIPLPSGFVDIMFSVNAIDHVDDFEIICDEIIRVLRSGGEFIGSFNLEEPPTIYEPQQLNEKIIKKYLLNKMEIKCLRTSRKGPEGNQYAPLLNDEILSYKPGEEGILWVRAEKP